MKKLIALLLCACLALGMVPAVAEDAAATEAAPQITSKTFPVYNKTTVPPLTDACGKKKGWTP